MKKPLTELEIYILRLAALAPIDPNWGLMFRAAHPSAARLKPESVNSSAHQWKKRQDVQEFFNGVKAGAGQTYGINGERETGRNSGETSGTFQDVSAVNFQDRAQYIDYLEQKIKTATDEKTRLDYIKLLSEAQQYKKIDPDSNNNEIQRFYTPVICSNCALYQAKKAEIEQ